jgi:hypothetical protein
MKTISIPLRVHSPAMIVLVSTLLQALLYIIAPLSYPEAVSGRSIGALFGFWTCLVLGMALGFRGWRSPITTVTISVPRILFLEKAMLIVGMLGMLIRFYENIVLRAGGSVTANFVANRALISQAGVTQTGSTALSIIAAVLSPSLFFLAIIPVLLRAGGLPRHRDYFLIFLSSMCAVFDLTVMGSRSTTLVWVASVCTAYFTFGNRKLTWIHLFWGSLGLLVFIWICGIVFWVRTSQMGMDPVQSMYTSAYSYLAPIDNSTIRRLSSGDEDEVAGFLYGYAHICQYLLHGVHEFLYLIDNASGRLSYGLQNLYIPAKLIWVFVGTGPIELYMDEYLVRPGVFTTLFGPIYYDFGFAGGLLACLIIGYLSGSLNRRFRSGQFHWLMTYTLITGLLPFTLVASMFTSGTGQYMLIHSLVLAWLLNFSKFSLSVVARPTNYQEQAREPNPAPQPRIG